MKKSPAFIIWLLFLFHNISAIPDESLWFKQISTKDGLSQNTVRDILIDQMGFIWAGTLDGLNRYDGSRFIIYKPKIGMQNSLSDHRVRSLFQDRNGMLWIRKYDNSYSCYDPSQERFIDLMYHNQNVTLNYTSHLQTSDGSIWLWAANSGCARVTYNGVSNPSIGFLSGAGDSTLTDLSVEFIFEDSQKNIWIGTQNGLNLLSLDGRIQQFYKDKGLSTFRKAVELNSILYFITEQNQIVRYNQVLNQFLPPVTAGKNCQFLDIVKLGEQKLLLTTRSHGLLVYNTGDESFNTNPFPASSKINSSAQLLTDSRHGVWIYDHSGILRHYRPETGDLRELKLIPPEIASVIDNERYIVFIDSRGMYWITTYGNGLFRYDPVTGQLENYQYNPQSNSPASNYLLSITEDRSGNIWLGSEYAGIIKVVRQSYKVHYIHPEAEDVLGTNNNVKVVFEDSREMVWIGTKNGSLYLYDKDLKKHRCIRKNLNPYTIIEDHRQRIWIGTKGNGVYVYNLSGTQELFHFQYNESNPNSLSHNSIFNILQDRDNRIWIASFGGGLDLLNEENNRFTFTHFFNNEGNKSYIRYLYQDKKGNIWTGSYEGLICFEPETFIANPNQYQIFRFHPNAPNGLNCNDIKTIYQDSQGQIWIGTAGGGLNLMQQSKTTTHPAVFAHYSTHEGLPSDVVTAILESRDSVLWISTENGISQFDHQQNTFMSYRFSERTQGNYYSENACALRKNGEMLWGTLDGFIAFNPSKFVKNNHVPPVILTDLYLFDQRAETEQHGSPLKESISKARQLRLTHQQNTFTLHFASLNLTDPEMNQYTYIMEPFDRFWSTPANENSATYKNLPPGSYTFKVKGSNADGQWNEQITQLQIVVTPPFWKSNTALLIYFIVALALLIITFMVIFKISNLNNAVRMEKQLTDYKLRFFTNISHEFRTPLTLIRGAVESLSADKELPQTSQKQIDLLNRNTRQMTRLIDQLLEFRKIQNNVLTLNLELTDLSDYILNIFYTFKEIASQKQIDYQVSVRPEKWEIYIDRNKVEKIIFNLLSNAFKFTPAHGTIALMVEKNESDQSCVITVKDSGCGIPKEKQGLLFSRFMQVHFSSEGTGVGLSLVKEFTEAHKGKVTFEENPGGGSLFRVVLPGSTSAYKDVQFIHAGAGHSDSLIHDQEHEPTSSGRELLKQASPHEWKILIIDDNKDIRDFLTEELGKHFITETAENGKIGLEMAINNNPDLIICDVKMPEMDGIEVTSRLKSEFQTSHIPIILLTALSSDTIRLKGSESGADAYIMKPFSLRYLLSRVYKLIEQREKLKKRYSIDLGEKEQLPGNTDKDKEFYRLIHQILDAHIANPAFSVEEFTELSGQKRTIFYKKVKGLTGYSPNDLIKIKRMKKAAELLLQGNHTVAEVSWQIGIEDPFYFSKCFKAQFGCAPSRYAGQMIKTTAANQ